MACNAAHSVRRRIVHFSTKDAVAGFGVSLELRAKIALLAANILGRRDTRSDGRREIILGKDRIGFRFRRAKLYEKCRTLPKVAKIVCRKLIQCLSRQDLNERSKDLEIDIRIYELRAASAAQLLFIESLQH